MHDEVKLFSKISRTHSYWGRKPITGVAHVLSDLKKDQVFYDPFCGGGTPSITALLQGARVIASDLNPMAVFLTRVICRPIGISSLSSAFDQVKKSVSEKIQNRYLIKCPNCGTLQPCMYYRWHTNKTSKKEYPDGAKLRCLKCRKFMMLELANRTSVAMEVEEAAQEIPKHWYPKTRINTIRSSKIKFHHQLFTGRNLSSLTELLQSINEIEPIECREALQYVFTSILYSCSKMQMYSDKYPDSSQGWMALRYYVPPAHMEKNVWQVFEKRFTSFIECKHLLNLKIPKIRVTSDYNNFKTDSLDVCIKQADFFESITSGELDVDYVFIDPPYNPDIDYFGLSEFWGCWLKMNFNLKDQFLPMRTKNTAYLETVSKMLHHIKGLKHNVPNVTLAFRLGDSNPEDILNEFFTKAGFENVSGSRILYTTNRSLKNKKKSETVETYYKLLPLNLNKSSKKPNNKVNDNTLDEVKFYLRALAFIQFKNKTHLMSILSMAEAFLPQRLLMALKEIPLKKEELQAILVDNENEKSNEIAYNTLVCSLLQIILKTDGYSLEYVNEEHINIERLEKYKSKSHNQMPEQWTNADIIARNKNRRVFFCFEDSNSPDQLATFASYINESDNNTFESIAVMIVTLTETMKQRRECDRANEWRRGFFTSFDEIRRKFHHIDKNSGDMLIAVPAQRNNSNLKQTDGITDTDKATIISHNPVGNKPYDHYKLRFKLSSLRGIIPGQFVMIDTRKISVTKKVQKNLILSEPENLSKVLNSGLKSKSVSYLKRPFGIHRAFYPNFGKDYLINLQLPPQLSMILHTVFPNEFDILYKVLPNGIGTNELKELKTGDQINVMGPLGKGFNPRDLKNSREIDEVHVIGGGVGMAPLVFMVQALKLFSFNVKAFIGIESYDSLLLQHEVHANSYGEARAGDYRIYVDDLKDAGLSDSDIYVSFDKKCPTPSNLLNPYNGFVSEQYKKFVMELPTNKKVIAFVCGPKAMMSAIAKIAKENRISLSVLLENRMACGIGVCFSCVCKKTLQDGTKQLSRICLDGPLYSAEEVTWE